MKKLFYIIPVVGLLLFSCEKEEPNNNTNTNNTDTTGTGGPPKTFSAQVILTVLDSLGSPMDSVACIIPYHEATSAYIPWYTDTTGMLSRSVWYEEEFGGMPDSQFVSLEKGVLTDTIYIPLAGDNSTNYFTHTLD